MTEPSSLVDLLPHQPPMRLIESVIELVPGALARTARVARVDDWFVQGHFPGDPVVPAIICIELIAQTGGLAACAPAGASASGALATTSPAASPSLRVAAVGHFKFPAAARPPVRLETTARVVLRMGNMIRIEGEVTADGVRVASGQITLAGG